MLQKYYTFFLLLLLTVLLHSLQGCRYPYNTPQARMERRIQQDLKQKTSDEKRMAALNKGMDSNLIAKTPDSLSAIPDSIKPKRTNGKLGVASGDSAVVKTDSLNIVPDSLKLVGTDSLSPDSALVVQPRIIQFSSDSLQGPLQYNAKDSMIYDFVQRKIYLYGNAEVVYEQYELKSGIIELDFNTFTAKAEGFEDSLGRRTQNPFFSDGNQKFDARKIEYNFKSKKGKVFDASTEQGDGYFLSKATKFVSKDSDSTLTDDVIYSGDCTYTTCNHRQPHFGIRASKAKVIPNKLIVVGPSYLEIMGTPTPIVLPFGFFPITQTRRSGLIMSTNFDFSPVWGPGIRGIGYYFGISEHIDLAITGDFYTRGTIRVNATSNYNKQYKANGSFSIGFANTKKDEKGTPDYTRSQDFNLRWNHTQSPKAHPSENFSASVNFGTSNFYRNTTTTANTALQSTLQSNVSWSKRFIGTPFSLALGASHSQNTSNRVMTITLPKTSLNMNQIFPFKRKNPVGQDRWYERIGFAYNMTANNTFQIVDTLLFAPDGLTNAMKDAKYSVLHSPNLNMSFKLFKHINVQPSISYKEYWYFYANEQNFDPTLIVTADTTIDDETGAIESISYDTTYGKIDNVRDYGFNAVRDFSAGVSMNTQLFATGTFNIGRLQKIRAVLRPNVGFSWRPDYSNDFWGYYGEVQTDTRYPDVFNRYSRYDVVPGAGQQSQLNYSLNMRMEGKMRKSKRDTVGTDKYRNFVIINNVNISSSYNLAADSLQMSPVGLNANTTLFKAVNVTMNMTFDPYAADVNTNKRISTYEWVANKRMLRMTQASLNLSSGLTAQNLKTLFNPNAETDVKKTKENAEFQILQSLNLNYNLRVAKQYVDGRDSLLVTANELALNGSIKLSKGWNIALQRIGYDFSKKRVTYPDFMFSRNLHCWELGLSWQPEPKTFNFFLRVRPGSLGFINLPVRKTQFDPY
jgi:hypothetical protein